MIKRIVWISIVGMAFTLMSAGQDEPKRRVSGRVVEFGQSFSWPIAGETVTITSGRRQHRAKTNLQGFFEAMVPCGKLTTIAVNGNRRRISVPCRIARVNLGVISWRNGDFVSKNTLRIDGCRTCKP